MGINPQEFKVSDKLIQKRLECGDKVIVSKEDSF